MAGQLRVLREISTSAPGQVYIKRTLALAYEVRPCFDCGRRSGCEHREPELELVIAAHLGIGAKTWDL